MYPTDQFVITCLNCGKAVIVADGDMTLENPGVNGVYKGEDDSIEVCEAELAVHLYCSCGNNAVIT